MREGLDEARLPAQRRTCVPRAWGCLAHRHMLQNLGDAFPERVGRLVADVLDTLNAGTFSARLGLVVQAPAGACSLICSLSRGKGRYRRPF